MEIYELFDTPKLRAFNQQSRIKVGSSAQLAIQRELKRRFGSRYKFITSAPPASQAPDLVVEIDGKRLQFEIKARGVKNHVTMFDTSIRRGQPNVLLDDLADAISNEKFDTFEKMIDWYRVERDPRVGFPGDPGTPSSGKLPPELRTVSPEFTDPVYLHITTHFHESGDNYFAIFNTNTNQIEVFYTGVGPNVLRAPQFPPITKLIVDTYGGAYRGAMRIALKVHLAAKGEVLDAKPVSPLSSLGIFGNKYQNGETEKSIPQAGERAA